MMDMGGSLLSNQHTVLLKKRPWSTYMRVFAGSLVLSGYFQTTDSAQVSSSCLVQSM